MKKLDRLMPIALKKAGSLLNDKGKMPKEYKGYIASFGASVIMSGLKPAVAFYENTVSGSKENKCELMKVVLKILQEDGKIAKTHKSLMEFVLSNECKRNFNGHKQDILDAATALKLAIRTFEQVKEGDGDHA